MVRDESVDSLEEVEWRLADLRVLAIHAIPAALRQTVLAVGGQRILLVAVVRLPQTCLYAEEWVGEEEEEEQSQED